MGKPMNYGRVATSYGSHRWALSWKLDPLLSVVRSLNDGAAILDAGCGTGDYLVALHNECSMRRYRGFDVSPEMLSVAGSRCPWANLQVADADLGFPAEMTSIDFLYAVDVLHHIQHYKSFFDESARVLQTGGALIVITDSDADIRARTLAAMFPETVELNRLRYPPIEGLLETASRSGLRLLSRQTVAGHIELDARFMQTLASKALSELRLISDDEHERGMARAGELRSRGGMWLSQTTVLSWARD